MRLLKKITPKTVCGTIANLPEGEIYRISGTIRTSEIKDTPYGDATKFMGSFLAKNTEGDMFSSGVTYLPVVSDLIAGKLQDAQGEDFQGMDISLLIKKVNVKKTDGTAGYEFQVEFINEPTPNEHLLSLLETVKTLEAPKKKTPLDEAEDRPGV